MAARMTAAAWSRLIGATLCLFCSIAAHANDCRVADPELQGSYTGSCANGLAEGSGLASGTAEYHGGFRAGKKHGVGVKTWSNGDRYEGGFAEDKRQGAGVYIFGRGPWAGERYEGEFSDDKRHGMGAYRWPSGDVYTGTWVEDRPTGPPTQMMQARQVHERELSAALSATGTSVCRQMQVGIAASEWIRGTVVHQERDTAASRIAVRIESAGRETHFIDGIALAPGVIVRDSALSWTACW